MSSPEEIKRAKTFSGNLQSISFLSRHAQALSADSSTSYQTLIQSLLDPLISYHDRNIDAPTDPKCAEFTLASSVGGRCLPGDREEARLGTHETDISSYRNLKGGCRLPGNGEDARTWAVIDNSPTFESHPNLLGEGSFMLESSGDSIQTWLTEPDDDDGFTLITDIDENCGFDGELIVRKNNVVSCGRSIYCGVSYGTHGISTGTFETIQKSGKQHTCNVNTSIFLFPKH